MLYWTLVFFILSLVAAIFGFGGIADTSADIAKILFFISLVLFIITGVASFFGRGPRNPHDIL